MLVECFLKGCKDVAADEKLVLAVWMVMEECFDIVLCKGGIAGG